MSSTEEQSSGSESEEYTSEEEEEEEEEEEKEEEKERKTEEEKTKHIEEKNEEIKLQQNTKKEEQKPSPPSLSKSATLWSEKTTPRNFEKNQSGLKKMTQQRSMLLKSLILNKAREELKREAERKAVEKKAALSKRLEPIGDLRSMTQQELMELCRQLHAKIDKVDEQRYDIEAKVKKNDQEIEDLNLKIFELRGKFRRPPLRRVRVSADQMLRALLGSKHKVSLDLRSNLKSVKKDGPKKDEADVKDWRENVEAKQGAPNKWMAKKDS